MEWIRISDNKLKIMLTADDARRYALDCQSADYAEALTREAFRAILTDVRAESGFDTSDEKIYIQMYPSKEGGCELFVTRIGLLLSDENGKTPSSERKKSEKKPSLPRKRSVALLFEELSHLLALCRRLLHSGYQGESEAWQAENGDWWLICKDGSSLLTGKEYRYTAEYAQLFGGYDVQIYLSEHGKCICRQDAISLLAKL